MEITPNKSSELRMGGLCPHVASCALYPLFKSAEVLQAWKDMYCTRWYHNCERYKLAVKGQKPAIDLLPNGAILKKFPEVKAAR